MVFILTLFLSLSSVFASDKSEEFHELYQKEIILPESLKQKEIILIPGIVAESFYWSDNRSVLDFAFVFKNYFGAQQTHYKKAGIPVTRLWASSKSVLETVHEIDEKMKDVAAKGRKAIFITHSLGGLALLDWLMKETETKELVESIVFIQSPFYGSPVASLYFENPYLARTLLGPIMPFVHTSEETVKYLSVEESTKRMQNYKPDLLKNIRVITFGGVSLTSSSIFRPSLNLMGHGCISWMFSDCRSKVIYNGPYSDSDGMVPFKHSKLEGIDFVKLKNVDHGETVLQMPFNSIDRVKLTNTLLKMVLP